MYKSRHFNFPDWYLQVWCYSVEETALSSIVFVFSSFLQGCVLLLFHGRRLMRSDSCDPSELGDNKGSTGGGPLLFPSSDGSHESDRIKRVPPKCSICDIPQRRMERQQWAHVLFSLRQMTCQAYQMRPHKHAIIKKYTPILLWHDLKIIPTKAEHCVFIKYRE